MSLTARVEVGNLRCTCLHAGHISLDGGAMFGVVAKPLWEKHFQPDERNRIRLALRCLLVEHPAGPVLIDTGVGNKSDDKFTNIYGLENEGTGGRTLLEDALAEAGFAPEDVRYVINTHLHFDHAGGNTFVERKAERGERGERGGRGKGTARPPDRPTARGGEGKGTGKGTARLSFPNATYVVQRGELHEASHPNERTKASYLAENIEPITAAKAWQLLEGETEVLPGISVLPTPGHTPFHQSVLVSDQSDTVCFAGDCIPTTAHASVPWIMAYDLEPLTTLATKKQLLARAESEAWTVVFEHDPTVAIGKIGHDAKSYAVVPLDTQLGQP